MEITLVTRDWAVVHLEFVFKVLAPHSDGIGMYVPGSYRG